MHETMTNNESLLGVSSGLFLGGETTELKSDGEESPEVKPVKVRTSSSSHKVKDHNGAKQICLCVYLYTATEADLALWWKTRVTRRAEMSKWQSCGVGEGSICRWTFTPSIVTLTSSYTQRTRMHTKAELSAHI